MTDRVGEGLVGLANPMVATTTVRFQSMIDVQHQTHTMTIADNQNNCLNLSVLCPDLPTIKLSEI